MDRRAASAAALALRQAYRRDAALLLLSPPAAAAAAESSGAVGRALLLRSGREVPPAPSTKSRSQRGSGGAGIGVAHDDNEGIEMFRPGEDSCAPCGHPFFALPTTGTTHNTATATAAATKVRVRSLGRGRTRRRRASRIRARDIARRTTSGKDRGGGRQWAAGSSGGVQQSSAWAGSGSVRDGTARHSVVYVCGNCGHRTRWGRHKRQRTQSEDREEGDTARMAKRQKRNGTARNDTTKKKTATATAVPGGTGKPTSAAAGISKRSERNQHPEGDGGYGVLGGDFVSLLPSSNRKRKNASNGADGGRKGGLGKEGGGKKSQKRKTKLLDFLSSLNG